MEQTRNIRRLNELNRDFYEKVALSFSDTRSHPWNGWGKGYPLFERLMLRAEPKILDLGCGNGRFKRYLAEALPDLAFSYTGVDTCRPLAGTGGLGEDEFHEVDIVERLLRGGLNAVMPADEYDLVVAFGLMHHIPSVQLRTRLVGQMVRATNPGGFGVLSFWQFMKDPRLAAKAEDCTVEGLAAGVIDEDTLEKGDYLLGWQDRTDVFRYCHNFTDDEVSALFNPFAADAQLLGGFRADGKADNLNLYAVFTRM